MSAVAAGDGLDDVYEALERYDWDNDEKFQSGLRAILGANTQSPAQAAVLALHARCFYWTREKRINVDFNAYQAYREARNRPPPTPPTAAGTQASSVPDMDFPPTQDNAAGGIMPAPATADEPPAPYPTSFAHIVELITSGKPVPGIKEIPPTILEGQGTEAAKPRRRKPWEKDDAPATQEPALSLTSLDLEQSKEAGVGADAAPQSS
ncbi:hypothetical protein ACN47E_006994 [Coniothyrium glycines]